MSRTPRASALLAVVLTLACNKSADPAPKAEPASKPPADAKQEAKAPPVQAHDGSAPHGADPHAANPHAPADPHAPSAANPHAGMPAAAPAGPPREVSPSGEVTETKIATLSMAVPKEWEQGQVTGSMRLGQFVLPGPGGDGELVLFRFPGGAGGVEANLTRWKGQFKPPEGKTIDDIAQTKTLSVGDLKITTLDVQGTFGSGPGPSARPTGDTHRMLAAIVEGKGDPYFLKALGPAATMDLWADAFGKTLESLKAE